MKLLSCLKVTCFSNESIQFCKHFEVQICKVIVKENAHYSICIYNIYKYFLYFWSVDNSWWKLRLLPSTWNRTVDRTALNNHLWDILPGPETHCINLFTSSCLAVAKCISLTDSDFGQHTMQGMDWKAASDILG